MEFDLNQELDGANIYDNDSVEKPSVGMCFDSGKEYADFCHIYASPCGFQFFTRTCELFDEFKRKEKQNKLGEEPQYHMLKRLRLVCVRGGKNKTADTSKSQLTGCKAYVDARMQEGRMRITIMNLEHNHPMYPSNSRFMINYKYMTDYHKRRMLINDAAGIPVKKNFNSLVVESGGHENLPFTERDMRNVLGIERRRSRLQGDAVAVEQYFKTMKIDNPNFFSSIQRDSEGRLMNVFWSDARCRAMAKDFGDVVTFDTTHLTNRYRMPFAPFIGVNHHGSSIVLACGLLSYEDADTFIWLFQCWLECMGRPPNSILTDQCKAIGKAVEIVFPGVRHRLCLFHLLQNATRNLGSHMHFKDIYKDMKDAVHESLTLEEFEEAWLSMVEKFQLHDNCWIKDAYEERKRWVPGYWRDSFWAGMSSTQRSEGMNFFFKGYVNSNSCLKLFVDQFRMAIANKVEEEKKLNADSMERLLTCNRTILAEDVFHKAYTNAKFKEFQEEVRALLYTNATKLCNLGDKTTYEVAEKIVNPIWRTKRKCFMVTIDRGEWDFTCSCKLFEFRGILCKHIIQVLEIEEITHIPEKYVLDRWRKNVVREYESIQVNYYDPSQSERVKKFRDLSLKNDYLVSLALHNEVTYNAYMKGLDNLQTTLESVVGITCGSTMNSTPVGCKVYGRRRLQTRDQNERRIAREKMTNVGDMLKDPPDQRGKGRAKTKRQVHPAEKGVRSKKKGTGKKTTPLSQKIVGLGDTNKHDSTSQGLGFLQSSNTRMLNHHNMHFSDMSLNVGMPFPYLPVHPFDTNAREFQGSTSGNNQMNWWNNPSRCL